MNEAADSQPQRPPTPALDEWTARGPVALIYSAHAGSVGGAHPQTLLERAGVAVSISLPVQTLDFGEPLGQRWRDAGCVAAVAAGGDGTVGAVATHIASVGLPLGILPMGTANDIARAMNVPLGFDDAARTIASGALHPIDAGQVIPSRTAPHAAALQPAPSLATLDAALTDPAPAQPERGGFGGAYFLHALTLGLNVEFARLATDVEQRKRWGRLTYVASAIESLERFHPIGVTLRFSGMAGAPEESVFVVQSETALLAAINLPVFGGRLGLRTPGVRTDDRLLDFILIEALEAGSAGVAFESALHALTSATQALWARRDATPGEGTGQPPGEHPVQSPAGLALPGARWFRARAAEIETERPVELTLDGELRGRTPAVARVAPRAIQIITSANGARVVERA
ncbi:MAG TPA: diacylglycerol kinase family protein [Ktedonobacterales bacterium]|nr:diacylglycerol kinase family protein [Ktedonobacterales bacterium]